MRLRNFAMRLPQLTPSLNATRSHPLGQRTTRAHSATPLRNLSVYTLNFFALCTLGEPVTLDIMANAQRARPARHSSPRNFAPHSDRFSPGSAQAHRFRKINFDGTNLPVVVHHHRTTIGGMDRLFPGDRISAPLAQSHISKLCKQGGGTVCDEFWHY